MNENIKEINTYSDIWYLKTQRRKRKWQEFLTTI
jgi:hypothetical protein